MIPMEYMKTMTDSTSWYLVILPEEEMTVAEVIDWLMKNDDPRNECEVDVKDKDFRLRYKDGKILGYDRLTINRFRNKTVARVLANGYHHVWSYTIELETLRNLFKAKG